jgi:hypothetical protein
MNLTCSNGVDGLKLIRDHLLEYSNLHELNLPTLGSSINHPDHFLINAVLMILARNIFPNLIVRHADEHGAS